MTVVDTSLREREFVRDLDLSFQGLLEELGHFGWITRLTFEQQAVGGI